MHINVTKIAGVDKSRQKFSITYNSPFISESAQRMGVGERGPGKITQNASENSKIKWSGRMIVGLLSFNKVFVILHEH